MIWRWLTEMAGRVIAKGYNFQKYTIRKASGVPKKVPVNHYAHHHTWTCQRRNKKRLYTHWSHCQVSFVCEEVLTHRDLFRGEALASSLIERLSLTSRPPTFGLRPSQPRTRTWNCERQSAILLSHVAGELDPFGWLWKPWWMNFFDFDLFAPDLGTTHC